MHFKHPKPSNSKKSKKEEFVDPFNSWDHKNASCVHTNAQNSYPIDMTTL